MVKAKATSKPKSKAKNTLGSSASKKTLAAKMSMILCCVGCGEFGKTTQFVRPGKFMKVSYNDSFSDKSI